MDVVRANVNARGVVRVQLAGPSLEGTAALARAAREARDVAGGPVEFLYSVPTEAVGGIGRDFVFGTVGEPPRPPAAAVPTASPLLRRPGPKSAPN